MVMLKRSVSVLAVVSLALSLVGAPACGTDAVGVDACREIEAARCDRAVECQIPLDSPRPGGDPVAACRRFYLDACLHGIQSGKDPTVPERKACVDAVTTGTCDVVRQPQRAPGCAFIIPADTPDAGAIDAKSDAEPAPPAPQPDAAK